MTDKMEFHGRPTTMRDASVREWPQPLLEARWCGHCGFPVQGDDASLERHVWDVCPIAKAKRNA